MPTRRRIPSSALGLAGTAIGAGSGALTRLTARVRKRRSRDGGLPTGVVEDGASTE